MATVLCFEFTVPLIATDAQKIIMDHPASHDEATSSTSTNADSPDAVAQRCLSGTPKYRYADLSQSSAEVLIEHEGQLYRLRTTRNGKLILIK